MSKINQLESLRVLKAVVEFGSFTAASQQLNLTVARISKSIERLEAELETRLFTRSTRHMQPTDSGERCYLYAVNMLEQWQGLTDELAETQTKPKGQIKISVPMSWGLSIFRPILAKFMAKYPDIAIDIHMNDLYVNVIEGEYDLVLRLANTLEDSSLICKKLKSYTYVACASPEYLEKHGTPITTQDLHNHNCLVYSQYSGNRKWWFSKNNKVLSMFIDARLKSNNSLLFKDALLSGQGIALIPDFIVEEEITSGELQPILLDYSTQELNLYSLRSPDKTLPMRLRLLNEFLIKELS